MGRHQILGLLCFLFFLHSSPPFATPLCPPDQREALLLFKNSFVLDSKVSNYSCDQYLQLTSYPKTNSWNKSIDCCSWDGVTCNASTSNVISLDLRCSWLSGALHSISSLLLLPNLQTLYFLGNNFVSTHISPDLSAFPETTHLHLSHSTISLQVLSLPFCNLTKFPYFLNSLEKLQDLDLSNNRISGEIPRWFWGINHDTLQRLDLSNNLLEGAIPQLHWNRLLHIEIQNNSFQGSLPIPPPSTVTFDASDNGFTGEIPPSICQLSSLWSLYLSNNNLSGYLPQCLGNITDLVKIDLSSNKLQGPLPRSLIRCVKLYSLILSHNEFSDIFPHWLEARQLVFLDLQSNKLQGRINLTVFGLSFPVLRSFSVSNNNLTGQWPTNVFSNSSLDLIDLSNNQFGGPIPLPSLLTNYYSIASNKITGNIPSLICNATFLQIIDLSNNGLIGRMPRCLTNSSIGLSILKLRMNHFEGTLPVSFCSRRSLLTLDLSRNQFEGTLPRSLVECKYLEVLDLSDNRIEDTFPKWLGTLQELKVLILRSNNFKGLLNISRGAHLFPKLQILDISNNNFGGPLPANLMTNLKAMMNGENGQDKPLYMTQSLPTMSYESSVTVTMKGLQIELVKILTIFTTIDLSCNSFQGDIPGVFGHLHVLIGLNLSHNHLTGSIPSILGNLTDLGWLDLSSNNLSGVIPRELGDLTFLGYLNLSKNQLIGRIPQDKQLSTFSNNSFGGNPGLCGAPLPKACPNDAQPSPPLSFHCKGHESWFKQKVVLIGYASGIVIGISLSYMAFETGRPKWLARGVRMLEIRAAKWVKKPKRKTVKFHGQ
ncbi:receptor-like protein 9DC3 [Rhodamnia argentea]|uniref:Receptor-like protein 9DC3 n=1 Tax=Rhodamnia argentea TaxID=178133 RepID=A0ABM3H363_9MYRT|nr:receptor-like protein 9DC3 [Rhodamnia argentea]